MRNKINILLFVIMCLFYAFKACSEVNIVPLTGALRVSVIISSICQYPISGSYNPQITKGSIGAGWQCSLDTDLQISKEIDFYTINAYCSKFVFSLNDDGTFSSGGSDRAALTFSNNNYILTANNGERLTFDPEGTLKSVQDISGKTAEISRDSNARISSWSIKSDKVESFSADDMLSSGGNEKATVSDGCSVKWNDNGTVSGLSAENKDFNFVYDKNSRLAKITIGNKEILASFEYDSSGKLISMTEPNHEYSFTYYEDNRVKTVEDQMGDDIYVEYEIIDGLNNCTVWNLTKFTETIYVLDKGKTVVTQSPIDSDVEFSAVINLTTGERTITNHLSGNTYVIKGDSKGNLQVSSNLMGFTPLVSDCNFLDSVTKNINDAEYFRESTVPSEFEVTESRAKIKDDGVMKDYLGNIIQVINKNFNAASLYYDKNNRLIKMATPSGGEYLYEYTDDGKTKKITNPFGNVQEYTYLPDNRVVISLPDNECVSISYDEWGFPLEIKEPQERETIITYSNRGEIETVELKGLDLQSFLSSLEDGLIALQSNTYGSWLFRDSFDGCLTRISPDGDVVSFNLSKKQLVSVSDSEEQILENYSYNKNGQLKEISTPQVSLSYKYDDRGRLVEKKYNKENFGVDFSYNKRDLVSCISDTGGFKTEYITDNAGKLVEIKNKKTGNFKIEYSNNGLIESIIYPNGITVRKSYDKAERLTQYICAHKNKELNNVSFQYDSLGNVVDVNNNGNTEKYHYDSLCHITGIMYQDGRKESFSFDKWGNFSSKKLLLSTDNQSRITTAKSGDCYLKFSYGYNNLLSKVESDGKNILEVYYNPVDNLPAMTVDSSGDKTGYIFIDNNLYAVIDDKKSEITRYIYIPGTDVCIALVRADGLVLYPVSDPSGTITALYDNNGNLLSKRTFDALGRLEGEDKLNIALGFQGALSLLNNRVVFNEDGQYLVEAQRLLSKIAPVPGKYALDFTNKLSYLDGNPRKNVNPQKDKNNNLELLDE